MSRLITITLLLFLFLASCKNKKISIDKLVKEMADVNMFEYKFNGQTSDSSRQWARYEKLLANSTELDLLQLCKNESPLIRSYAFLGLVDKKSSRIFEVLTNNISDTGEFERAMGCMVDPCYVTDFYLEQVGYFPRDTSSSYKITTQQREFLDSLMLFGSEITLRVPNYNSIRLRSRYFMLKQLAHKETYHNRLKEIVLSGVFEALPALAKFKNPNDISVIKGVSQTKWGFGYEYVFEAITIFPHPDLFEIVEKAVSNDLKYNNYFSDLTSMYYNALVEFKTPAAKALILQSLSITEGEYQLNRANYVKNLISQNSGKAF